jgi:hypothetical protein
MNLFNECPGCGSFLSACAVCGNPKCGYHGEDLLPRIKSLKEHILLLSGLLEAERYSEMKPVIESIWKMFLNIPHNEDARIG